MSFGSARTTSQQREKRAQHLSASRNSISRPRRNIALSFGTSGPYARCPLTFANDWTFHPATKAYSGKFITGQFWTFATQSARSGHTEALRYLSAFGVKQTWMTGRL